MSVKLSKEKEYCEINDAIYREAAYQSSSRLAKYLSDKENDWAQLFYEYITKKSLLTMVKTEVFNAHNSDTMVQFNNLLFALDPSGKRSVDYHKILYGTMISSSNYYMTPDERNAALLRDLMPDMLEYVANNWINQPSDPTDGQIAQQQMAQAILDLQKEMEGNIAVAGALSHIMEAVRAKNLVDSSLQIYNAMDGIDSKAWANFKNFASGISFMVGTAFVVIGYLNWDTLTKNQKISLIAQSVRQTATVAKFIPRVIDGYATSKIAGQQAIPNALNEWGSNPEVAARTRQWLSEATGEDFTETELLVNDTVDAIANRRAAAMNRLVTADAQGAAKVLAGISLIAAGVMSGIAIYTFVQDLANGESMPQTLFDGIQAVSVTLATICETLALVAESVLWASVATAFAIVGVIAAIAYLIWVRMQPPPPSPAENYISGVILPFVNKQLADPKTAVPSNWSYADPPSSETHAILMAT